MAATAATAVLVREAGGPATLTDVTLDAPGDGEVLVRVHASGVCPTDLFGMAGGTGDRFPAIFGHEGAGVVEAVGPDMASLRPGDHVVLSFDSCGRCPSCVDGHPASCDDFAGLNYRPRSRARAGDAPATTGWMAQPSWATHTLARATNAVRIDDDVPWEVAAPLGCDILTGVGTMLNVLAPGPHDTLLVVGAGTTGLAGVMAVRHRGVGRVVVSDPDPGRRAMALELGATDTFAPQDVPARTLAPRTCSTPSGGRRRPTSPSRRSPRAGRAPPWPCTPGEPGHGVADAGAVGPHADRRHRGGRRRAARRAHPGRAVARRAAAGRAASG